MCSTKNKLNLLIDVITKAIETGHDNDVELYKKQLLEMVGEQRGLRLFKNIQDRISLVIDSVLEINLND